VSGSRVLVRFGAVRDRPVDQIETSRNED